MTGFVQIIEFQSSRTDEIRALVESMPGSPEDRGGIRGTVTSDRDRPGFHLAIIEFDSYEAAMANSARPEVSEVAAKMAALCDGPPRFYNLDVVESWESGAGAGTRAAVVGAATAVAGAAAAGLAKARQRVQERRQSVDVTPPTTGTRTVGPPVTPEAPPIHPEPGQASEPRLDPPPTSTL